MPMTTLSAAGPAVSRIGLGLAALGRPAYITGGRAGDLPDRSVPGLRGRTIEMLDAAYDSGIRYFDAARSYGRAEEFLGRWLASREYPDAVAGSKWGYRYTGRWRLDADRQEVKEHSLSMFSTQRAQTRAILGSRLALYQVHSLTEDSGLLADRALLAALGRLRASGVIIGLTTSGPGQAATIRRALQATVDGEPLFSVAQVTWNLLEPSAAPAAAEAAAAGWTILVKEALANGRRGRQRSGRRAGPAGRARRRAERDGRRHRHLRRARQPVGGRRAVRGRHALAAEVQPDRAGDPRPAAARPRRAAGPLLGAAGGPALAVTGLPGQVTTPRPAERR